MCIYKNKDIWTIIIYKNVELLVSQEFLCLKQWALSEHIGSFSKRKPSSTLSEFLASERYIYFPSCIKIRQKLQILSIIQKKTWKLCKSKAFHCTATSQTKLLRTTSPRLPSLSGLQELSPIFASYSAAESVARQLPASKRKKWSTLFGTLLRSCLHLLQGNQQISIFYRCYCYVAQLRLKHRAYRRQCYLNWARNRITRENRAFSDTCECASASVTSVYDCVQKIRNIITAAEFFTSGKCYIMLWLGTTWYM